MLIYTESKAAALFMIFIALKITAYLRLVYYHHQPNRVQYNFGIKKDKHIPVTARIYVIY